jgi:mannose-6-phosphate isomerase-like protein (cupin superfamily)
MGLVPDPAAAPHDAPLDARPLDQRYWYVEGTDARRIEIPVAEFWPQVMSGDPADPFVAHLLDADGWLVTQYDVDGTADHEEMHPEGDELHYLVTGDLDFVLAHDDGAETVITMRPGTMINVPRGVWHRIQARTPSRAVAFTAGRGTRHRPITAPDPEHRPAS